MPTISDYLNQLQIDKETLKTNLIDKEVEVLDTDTFTELSAKVIDIESKEIITKGIIIDERKQYMEYHPTKVTMVGMTSVPEGFFSCNENNDGIFEYLKTVIFPDNLTSISSCAFMNNKGITDLVIPDSVDGTTGIMDQAFYNCSNLKNITLSKNLTGIRPGVFYGCTNLELTSLPSGIREINGSAFYGCTKLALTSLPDVLKSIALRAFYNCTNLALTSLPDGITTLENETFYGCTNLALTSLPSGLTSLGEKVFYNCTKLSITEIPSGVTTLSKQGIFNGCSNLTKIKFLGDISEIYNASWETDIFGGCVNLAEISFPNVTKVPSLATRETFTNTPIADGTGIIYVPDALVDSFKSATNWSSYADQIKPISELEASE